MKNHGLNKTGEREYTKEEAVALLKMTIRSGVKDSVQDICDKSRFHIHQDRSF